MTDNYYARYLELIELYPDLRDDIVIQWLMKNQHKVLRDYPSWEPKQTYKYMLTFTIDPKKESSLKLSRDNLQAEIEAYIIRLMRDKRFDRVWYVKEHADTNCHWHVIVYMSHSFKHDHIRYYKKKYGSVHVSRSRVLSDEPSEIYLSKEPGQVFHTIK